MSDQETKTTLDQLMARRGNSSEFILELEGYQDDLKHGELDNQDKTYIRDLAKRLGKAQGHGTDSKPPEAADDDIGDEEDWAEEEEHRIDTRFDRVKAAFEERFNPDTIDADAPDAAIRRQVYEEFQAELERIEGEG